MSVENFDNQKLINSSAVDLLLIEIVPLVQNVVAELHNNISREDDVYYRVEGYGYRVGLGLSEIFSRDRIRFSSTDYQLDVMKFICKELWVIIFKKQIDNLKTNHRGTYVLIDNNFKYCQRMSTSLGSQGTIKQATPYIWFPVGLIRGVLAGLNIRAQVSFDTNQLPQVSFNIQT
jgi:hypothetical protein